MIRLSQVVTLGWLTRRRLVGMLGLFIVFGGSAWVAYVRPDIEGLAVYGYPGLFVFMFASSASVLFPLPGFAAVMAAGTVANPLLIALFAGPGSALGELTGYLAGYGGRAIIEDRHISVFQRIESWVRRHGFWALLVLALIPNPAFDVVGLAAGSLGYPAKKFLLACLVGNTLKYFLLASAGGAAINLFVRA